MDHAKTLEWLERAVEFINSINGGDRDCPMCDQDRNAGECSENCCINEMEQYILDAKADASVTAKQSLSVPLCIDCNSSEILFDCYADYYPVTGEYGMAHIFDTVCCDQCGKTNKRVNWNSMTPEEYEKKQNEFWEKLDTAKRLEEQK